ncbi:hypothetical protein AKKGGB_AKKGGB_09440, partial [Dysosmobacter welbionis]
RGLHRRGGLGGVRWDLGAAVGGLYRRAPEDHLIAGLVVAGGLVSGGDQLAVGVVDIAVCPVLVPGVGRGLDLLRARRQGGVVLIHRLIGRGGEVLVGHLHAGAVHIGAQDPDRQVIVFIDGDDLDGVQGVVGELVVRPAPGHRGVH